MKLCHNIYQRMLAVSSGFVICGSFLAMYLAFQMKDSAYLETALRQSQYTLTAGSAEGTIYDRNFISLVNQNINYYAAVNPTPAAMKELFPHIQEISPVLRAVRTGKPFLCQVDTNQFSSPEIKILEVPQRYSENPSAQHILGYTLEHTGITGLESDYDSVLRAREDTASVSYMTDALGHVLSGAEVLVSPVEYLNSGIVTTLDSRIQKICESQEIEKGAVVVMEIQTGDVLAMASFPDYTPDHIGDAISSPDSPLINRCLYAYNVGSIFKLMTCAAAYTQNLQEYRANCTGSFAIKNQLFRCHNLSGHGSLDMKQAVILSCNSYFIQLSQLLQPALMRETAQNFGFGTQIPLTHSIISESGTLPTIRDLNYPAEMANFCFGQGLLTATPLQITQMTCGIANNGQMPIARLMLGITQDGRTISEPERSPIYARAIKKEAAYYLQNLMIAAINENENSNAVPDSVFAAGKTSTAQTGRFDESGSEYCHAWITGYFPIDHPQYAVTVLIEDGGYGNTAAAPVFKDIADKIMNEN
ncbi:MAG: hypothetical protein IJ642_06525 [Oscillospiraceae bacterium]|nr:hypothetical protein [Oscillospiraceae bacterium]